MLFRFCFNLVSRFRGLVYNANLDKYFSFMKGGHRSKIITHFVTKGCITYFTRDRNGRGRIVVGYKATYAINAYHQ
jgi:hypothetical protein